MIGKFIAGLTDFQKKLLIVAGILLVIVLFDRLLINPTMSKLSSIDQEILSEEVAIKRDLNLLKHKNELLKDSKALEAYISKDVLAEEEMIASFLKKIESLAGQAKVSLVKVTPAAGEKDKELLKYRADLECNGLLTDVVAFMHLINSSDDLLKVVKFNLGGKKADTDEIKATMSILKIVVPAKPLSEKPAGDAKSVSISASMTADKAPAE